VSAGYRLRLTTAILSAGKLVRLYNDAVLVHLRRNSDASLQLPEGWATDKELPDRAAASKLLAVAYPERGFFGVEGSQVLPAAPVWRVVLHASIAAVLVWRLLLAAARSLRHRDGSPLLYGVALCAGTTDQPVAALWAASRERRIKG
jgi:hypothetical protein